MKLVSVAIAVAFVATAAQASDGHKVLTGNSLKRVISGKTIHLHTPVGSTVPIRYRSNGTMVGKSSTSLAKLAGESVNKDRGRWWIRKSQLCQQWQNWSDGQAFCYTLRMSGDLVYWKRNDGKRGTARLSN